MSVRHYPSDKSDREEIEGLGAAPWQIEALRLNPGYCAWGPYEDYMAEKGGGWNAAVLGGRWGEDGGRPPGLDDLNEVVNFYFSLERDSTECEACGGSGLNPASRAISDGFYAHSSPTGIGWNGAITEDEVEALIANHRLWRPGEKRPRPTAAEVNAANGPGRRGFGIFCHDAINRWILIETRCKRLGVWGICGVGPCLNGRVFTETACRLALTLWVLHPRKGCSRAWGIREIPEAALPEVYGYLAAAAKRNAARFGKAVRASKRRAAVA